MCLNTGSVCMNKNAQYESQGNVLKIIISSFPLRGTNIANVGATNIACKPTITELQADLYSLREPNGFNIYSSSCCNLTFFPGSRN